MPGHNVEVVRRSNAAFNRGDRERAFADYRPDVEWRDLQHAPDVVETVRGIAAIQMIWDQWIAAFDQFTAELEECVEAGEFVVAVVRWRARGEVSGLSLDLHTADLYEFADGKVLRVTLGYSYKQAALAAAEPRPERQPG